jgi:hypothetical protein
MSDEDASVVRPRLSLFGLLALGIVVAGVAFLLVGTHNTNEAPFTAVQANPKLAGLQIVHSDGPGSATQLEGRVMIDDVAAQDATYAVIVIDDRRHRVVPVDIGDPKPSPGSGSAVGWDRSVASLRERFDWKPSDGDQAAFFKPGSVTSFPFVAPLSGSALPVANVRSDLTVVLALTHGSDHVYWAVKLD